MAPVTSRQRNQSTTSILRGLPYLCRRMHLSPSNPRVFCTAHLAHGFFARSQRPFYLIYLSNKRILVLGHPGIFLNTLFLVYRKPYKAKLVLTSSLFLSGAFYIGQAMPTFKCTTIYLLSSISSYARFCRKMVHGGGRNRAKASWGPFLFYFTTTKNES